MRDPAIGDRILVVTNDPNPHDYAAAIVTAYDASKDRYEAKEVDVHGSIDPDGQVFDIDSVRHVNNRVEGAEPMIGEWAFGDTGLNEE